MINIKIITFLKQVWYSVEPEVIPNVEYEWYPDEGEYGSKHVEDKNGTNEGICSVIL